jgi:hypothetical protein
MQTDKGDEELCSVYVPTNHLYIGDIFLVNSAEIIRPNLSIREGIGWFLALFLVFTFASTATVQRKENITLLKLIPLNSLV